MIKGFLLCSAVLVSSLMAQTTFDDGADDGVQAIYLEQITSFTNAADLEKGRNLFQKWDDYFRFDMGLFEDDVGVLIFTMGEANTSTELKLNILFENSTALLTYLNAIDMNPGLKNETDLVGENWETTQKFTGNIPKFVIEEEVYQKVFKDATVNFSPVSQYQFGPFVHGWLNYPAETYTQDPAIVQNVAFVGKDAGSVEIMRGFIDQLEVFLQDNGMFGSSLLMWKIWNNEIGMTGTTVFNGVEGWHAYNAAIKEFCQNKTICEQWDKSTVQTFDQFIAVNSQMALEPKFQDYTKPGNSSNLHGIPNLELYGSAAEWGVQLGEFKRPSVQMLYLSVPVFNGIAAYMNYDQWAFNSNEWSLVMYAEVWNACISLTGLAAFFLLNESYLVDFARVSILSEFVTGFLAYTAYSESNPNGDAMKTSTLLSFLSVATGVIAGIFVQFLV